MSKPITMAQYNADACALIEKLFDRGCPVRVDHSSVIGRDGYEFCIWCDVNVEKGDPHEADCPWTEIQRLYAQSNDMPHAVVPPVLPVGTLVRQGADYVIVDDAGNTEPMTVPTSVRSDTFEGIKIIDKGDDVV